MLRVGVLSEAGSAVRLRADVRTGFDSGRKTVVNPESGVRIACGCILKRGKSLRPCAIQGLFLAVILGNTVQKIYNAIGFGGF